METAETVQTFKNNASPIPENWSEKELEDYKLHRRFDRMGRLVGDPAMKKLLKSHVMVIGLGGVGSWAAEMLVRSGVGEVTLVDFDEVCITNFNRQLHAVQGQVGQQKVNVMAERLKKINPAVKVNPLLKFFNQDSRDEIFTVKPDYVIDAIDSVTPKCMLLDHCLKNKIPVICATGSAGKLDPTRIQISDLADTEMDPLAKAVRRILRQQYGFPEKGEFGIQAVYSPEAATSPEELKYDNGQGFKCVCPQGQNPYFNCDNRNVIMGSAGFVTSAFGMACASKVVRDLISQ